MTNLDQTVAAQVDAAMRPLMARADQLMADARPLLQERRDALLTDAVRSGRIAATDRPKWEQWAGQAPGVVAEVLASTAPGAAVPVNWDGVVPDDVADEAEYRRLTASLNWRD